MIPYLPRKRAAGTHMQRPTFQQRFKTHYYRAVREKVAANYKKNPYYLALSLMGSIIGYVQMWRVPDLAYQYGGIIFFVIYALSLVTISNAAAFIQSATCQFTGKPSIESSDYVPIAKGIAYSSMLYTLFFITYNVEQACYPAYYFMTSVRQPLRWMTCPDDKEWESKYKCDPLPSNCNGTLPCEYPSAFHFRSIFTGVFPKSFYISQTLGLSYVLLITHFLAWLLVYFGMYHNIHASAVVTTILVTVFYFLLIVYSCAAFSHPGAIEGLVVFFTPNWKHFINLTTWQSAISQAFISMGVGLPIIGNMYYKAVPAVPSHKLMTAVSFKIMLTSLVSIIFVHSIMGVVSARAQVPFNSTNIGPGLFLIALSEATQIFGESQWLSCFTFLLASMFSCTTIVFLAKGIFCNLEVLYPKLTKDHPLKLGVILVAIASCLGFPIITKFGWGYFNSFHYLSQPACVLFIVAIRFILITHCYGVGRFCEDVEFKLSWYPNSIYRYMWAFPGFVLIGLSCFSLVPWLKAMDKHSGESRFDAKWLVIGILMFATVLSPFIYFAIVAAWKCSKDGKISDCFKPNPKFCPLDLEEREMRKRFVSNRRVF